ncbi:hypothetical protein S7335_4772 [Synechococcus sp. PCC 7335]|uniref:hypothetical protein n=1 Tax=Synechococcus sp. (strain ATCC 29403 / PCC 7335) TaxID=91464 RepID=UPI00017EE800|nr:hypothetical protein [Synechococcus sp. PCC 7335]EDX87065.1 hypothetical protein S7335_4772 [Synechococcus sp. PCC 7335]
MNQNDRDQELMNCLTHVPLNHPTRKKSGRNPETLEAEMTTGGTQEPPLTSCHQAEPEREACDLETPLEAESVYVGVQGRSHTNRQAKSIRAWQQRRHHFDTFRPL